MTMIVRRCLGRQYRRMTDDLAGLWLYNLKPQDNLGRRDGDSLQSEYVAKQMLSEINLLKSEGWDLGDRAYSTAISAVAGYGNSEVAQQLFDDMVDSGKKPGPKVFVSLMFAFAHDGRDPDGVKFFSAYEQFRKAHPDTPTDSAFAATVIHGLCKKNRLEMALEAMRTFRAQGVAISTKVYNMLLAACSDMGEANEIRKDMEEAKCDPDVVSFGSLFKVCSKTLDTDEAELVMAELRSKELAITVKEWTGYLTVFKAAGDYERVIQIWDEMKANDIEPNSIAYGALIKSHCDALKQTGDAKYEQLAITEFQNAKQSGCVTSTRLVTVMMQLYSLRKNAAAADELLSYALDRNLVEGYCKKYYSLATGKRIR